MAKVKAKALCLCVLLLQAGAIAYSFRQHNISVDEGNHILSGLLVWEEERFDFFPVNPPLIKALVALPVVTSRPELSDTVRWSVSRSSDSQNDRFALDNAERYLK